MSACSLLAIIRVRVNIMCNYVTGSSGCERGCVTCLDKWMACWQSVGLYLELCVGVLCVLFQRLMAYLGDGGGGGGGRPYRTADSKGATK